MRGNLPAEYTSFSGRAAEVAEGLRALPATRLLTVTGPGGAGKSRVAAAIARRARRGFPGGIWYVELTALTEAAFPGALEGGTMLFPGGLPERDISGSLSPGFLERGRAALLLLDTCEHLLAPVSRLAASLLREAPHVTIIATGRRVLDVAGQRVLRVGPLGERDATALFADRAAAVDPDFSLTGGNREAVAAICRRLDGLPLAIELAAAGLRSLSAAELLDRLPVLAAQTTSALPRHRDLRSLAGWSHGLCGARQRALWGALSVFRGTFSAAAAEAVGRGVGLAGVPGLLGDLVDDSVVLREGAGFRMLMPYREYGLGLLDARTHARLSALAPAGGEDVRPGTVPLAPAGTPGTLGPPEPPGPAGSPQRAGAEPGGGTLTARELQVARLIGEGLTNPQIADRLVISKRTVDAHVRNILAKGHLASRTHVAAWVTSSGRI
ncbi:LuxR C-terminal-related transcriptional regulator [Nonomuraea rhizosphaerae]|uniref:LuxR C-terminal-related transcriptional regulator n=1 Tax=Nonomuraea rhizosphaerae TaxID=2665663 RepID=UPI001C5DC814|nr:LuxR C-terminal-related transcriptional regulator [Nonomuraea rhizosphaerae]